MGAEKGLIDRLAHKPVNCDCLPVVVSDVSHWGARLSSERLPPQETEILLRVEGIEVFGRVAWSTGTQCGVEFSQPLSASQLARFGRHCSRGQIAIL